MRYSSNKKDFCGGGQSVRRFLLFESFAVFGKLWQIVLAFFDFGFTMTANRVQLYFRFGGKMKKYSNSNVSHNVSERERSNLVGLKDALKNGFTHSSSQFLRESDTAIKNGESYFAQPRAGAILESGNIEYKIYNETSTFKAQNYMHANGGKYAINLPTGLSVGSNTGLSQNMMTVDFSVNRKAIMEYGDLLHAKLVLNASQLSGGTGVVAIASALTKNIIMQCNMRTGKYEFDITDALINSSDDNFTLELKPISITQDKTNLIFNAVGELAPRIETRYVYDSKRSSPRHNIDLTNGVCGSLSMLGRLFTVNFADNTGAIGIFHSHNHVNCGFGTGNGFKLNIDERMIKNGDKYTYTDETGDSTIFSEFYYYVDDLGNIVTVRPDAVDVGADGALTSNGKRLHREVISEDGLRASVMNSGVKNAKYIEERQSEIVALENAIKNYKDALNEYVKTKKYASGDENNGTVHEYKPFTLDENNEISSFESFFKNESGYLIMPQAEANNYRSTVFQKMSLEKSETDANIKSKQVKSLEEQIEYIISKSGLDTPNEIFKQYMLKKNELKTIKVSTPVALIKDGDTVKGYNEDGRLIAVYTPDGNTVAIDRDLSGRAIRMYDSKDNTLSFSYNADGYLTSIEDEKGNFTEYVYNANGNLTKVIYPNNTSLELSYDSACHLTSIVSGKYKTNISYSGNAVASISKYALFSSLSNGATSGGETLIETISVSGNNGYADIKSGSVAERYEFNSVGDYSGYIKEVDGKVTEAERYTYRSGEMKITEYAALSSLNSVGLDSYNFVCGESETVMLNAFNMPVKVITEGKCLDVNGSVKTVVNSVANYTYNAEQKIVKIITEVTTKKGSSESKKNVVERFSYDGYGRLVKNMRYVEGEEEKTGVYVEENEYGDDGEVKTYSYNTLSSSERLVSGGSKDVSDRAVSYGTDRFGNINSVVGDDGSGEANVGDSVYTHGLLTRVKSGSADIKYGYDHKGRVKSVSMNGVNDYLTVVYSDKVSEEGKTVNKVGATLKGDKLSESVYDLSGNLIKVKYNNAERIRFNYDSRRRLSEINDSVIKFTSKNTYDTLDRLTKYEFAKDSGSAFTLDNVKEEYTYNNDGLVSKKVETVGNSVNTYTYTYSDDSEKTLDAVNVGALGYGYEYDGLKRKRNRKVTVSGNKIAEERISYRRDGESASVNVSGVRFGNVVDGKFVSSEGVKYVYDENGNISATYINGVLGARYRYDGLSRLVREDNKSMNKTYVFAYDDSGNITYKGETAFTLDENISENNIAITAYGYDGDRLVRFGSEVCEYDAIGNPTKYRSKTLVWNNGRELTKYGDTTFAYDGEGRRVSKNGNKFSYSSDGRLIKESRGIEYLYDGEGVSAIKYNGAIYHMQKNGQGDVIMLLDNNGKVVVRYVYDAFGNHTVQDPNGTANGDASFIGNINPIRYRSYYYDTETGLYFLQSRYYDPKTGRFISIDDISYVSPNTVNGINLYAYCLNNPVMMVDPSGCWTMPNWLKWVIGGVAFAGAVVITALTGGSMAPVFIGMGVSIVSGGLIQGTVDAINGGSFLQGLSDGMADGALWGGVAALGGAAIRGVRYVRAVKTQNYNTLAKLFTHNKYANKVMIGKWDGGGATSYVAKAGRTHTYFSMPDRIYSKLFAKFGKDNMWKINQAFLSQNINKVFYASHNIWTAIPGTSFYEEIKYLFSFYKNIIH